MSRIMSTSTTRSATSHPRCSATPTPRTIRGRCSSASASSSSAVSAFCSSCFRVFVAIRVADHATSRLALALLLWALPATTASAQGTRLLRRPTVSRTHVAFEYAGDLWVVPRGGGEARRLTATPEAETDPHFSPDGARIAFTSTVRGNTDVFVVPTAGGEPTRL